VRRNSWRNPYNSTSALIFNYLAAGFFRFRPRKAGLLEYELDLSSDLHLGMFVCVFSHISDLFNSVEMWPLKNNLPHMVRIGKVFLPKSSFDSKIKNYGIPMAWGFF
jgi:hypothetical protein